MDEHDKSRQDAKGFPSIHEDMLSARPASPQEIRTIGEEMFAEPEPSPEPADPRVDFEKGMSLAPRAPLLLIGANIIIFVVTYLKGALESKEAIVLAGALSRAEVMAGQYWRLGSAMFLHGSFGHLFGNCVALFVLGVATEHAYGKLRTTLLYLVAGLGAGLLSTALSPGPSVGASGAIFGLMGVMIVFFRKYGKLFILRDNRVGVVLIVWAIYSILTALAEPYIDNAAHVGGLLTGAVLALLLPAQIATRVPRGDAAA
ncbi:MAG: rhomboid family intramembrane serine protease [Acidobacteria bacterium]|nr:rhomboid family intramembrane serine protease [Acidobacteriota bacterium]